MSKASEVQEPVDTAAASKSEDIDIEKQQQQPNGLQNGHAGSTDESQDALQQGFELAILVPQLPFSKYIASSGGPKSTTGGSAGEKVNGSTSEEEPALNLDEYHHLTLPSSGQDTIRDIRQAVLDSADGCWLGAHSFRRVKVKEHDPPSASGEPDFCGIEGAPSEVFNEATDLATVFKTEDYADLHQRKVLVVAEIPYTEAEARNHIIRLHEIFLAQSSPLHSRRMYQPTPYDPAALVYDSGVSLFTALCGTSSADFGVNGASSATKINGASSELTINEGSQTAVNGVEQAHGIVKGGKKGKGKSKPKGLPSGSQHTSQANAHESAAPSTAHTDASEDASWLENPASAFDLHLLRKSLLPISSLPPQALKSMSLSVWNPPPPHLRLRGHFVYLNVTTLEGENINITGGQAGFYANKSDSHHFDPSPRIGSSKHQTYHSLFCLLAAYSPKFASGIQAILTEEPLTYPDLLATAPISTCIPAAPWLVDAPEVSPDGLRSQLAYLHTGATSIETLPNARDWNEELTNMRELPHNSQDECIIRDRYAVRVLADFHNAAARGVAQIARGDVPCLNAAEPGETKSYLLNNILYTVAQDSVDAFAHLGGNEATRITSSKDVHAAKLLQDADIPNLHVMASAVVDYAGERWIAQAIPPGIFNRTAEELRDEKAAEAMNAATSSEHNDSATVAGSADATHAELSEAAPALPPVTPLRAVYGPANTDKPHEGYISDVRFAVLAEKIAKHFHLGKHTVTDTSGRTAELWTPSEMHGVFAADGRAYVIDLFRLFVVDVNFLEKDIDGKVYGAADLSNAESTKYPHRVVLLRPELIQTYHATKTRDWINEQVALKSAEPDTEDLTDSTVLVNGEGGSDKSVEEPANAISENYVQIDGDAVSSPKQPSAKRTAQKTIDVGDFELAFNPDAFADRPDRLPHTANPEGLAAEETMTANVRAASDFLRAAIIPTFLREVVSEEILPLDSSHLSQILHKKGINIRYLGIIAEATTTMITTLESSQQNSAAKEETRLFLEKFRAILVRDMVTRAAKHVMRRYIAGLQTNALIETICLFLNCLLASGNLSAAGTNLSSGDSSALSTPKLRAEVLAEVAKRYRYNPGASSLDEDLARPQLLRELCLANGIQLSLRSYAVSRQSIAAPQTNGHVNGHSERDAAVITPDDILNVHPVVKKAPYRSASAEDLLERGQMLLLKGAVEHGDIFLNDGLAMYEQVYTSVHPEVAEAWRAAASMYHRISQSLQRRVQMYEATELVASEEDRNKIKAECGIPDQETLEQTRLQAAMMLAQAPRIARQALIVSERTTGLDSAETLQCYSDLALYEHAAGDLKMAMKLLKHSMAVSSSLYGEDHPERAKAAYFAASMLKNSKDTASVSAIPFYQVARRIAAAIYGPNALLSGNSAYQLGQCYVIGSQLQNAVPFLDEAVAVYEARLGPESDNAKEARQLQTAVKQTALQRERSDLERVEKLAKRLGSDPARAKELMDRMSRASSNSAAPELINGVVAEVKANDKTGSRGHLELDELVKFIQGNESKVAPAKSKKKSGAKR